MFSFDTEKEAQQAIVRYGVHRYDGSIAWTGWPHEHDPNDTSPMEEVTDELRRWWEAHGDR